MSDLCLRNFEALEGTAPENLTLKRPSRKIVITNDSAGGTLGYKFNESEEFGTLEATESVSLFFTTRTVFLDGAGAYRVWVYS